MITLAMFELAGRFVPIVTPFTDDGATLSEVRLSRLLRHYIQLGFDGFVLASETGEFPTQSLAERKSLVEFVMRHSQNAIPVVVNVTSLSTSFSLDLAQHAARHGARAVILAPPFLGPYSQSEHVQHIQMVGKHSKLPIIVVDPHHALQEEGIAVISHLPNVHIAWPFPDVESASADWFRCYGIEVSPVFGISESKNADFVLRNRAAVTKTLLLDSDLEVGSPRMPTLPIPYRDIRKVA